MDKYNPTLPIYSVRSLYPYYTWHTHSAKCYKPSTVKIAYSADFPIKK